MEKKYYIWNEKGGVGKTTIALQLVGYYSEIENKKVLIVDLDPQQSSRQVIEMGKFPENLVRYITKEPGAAAKDFDVIIYDYPPGRQNIPEAKGQNEKLIIPFQANGVSYRATLPAFELLAKEKQDVCKVLNMFDPRKKEHRELFEDLSSNETVYTIKSRSIYERTVGQGVSVFSDTVQNLYGIREAKEEIKKIVRGLEK